MASGKIPGNVLARRLKLGTVELPDGTIRPMTRDEYSKGRRFQRRKPKQRAYEAQQEQQ